MSDQNSASGSSGKVPDDTEQAVETNDGTLGSRGPDTDEPASKDPSEWVSGDEPMTAAQRSYLDTLGREAGEEVPADLTKAQASVEIERLQRLTGRGTASPQ
ncbi:DUF3072 domain-containing protein [Streptomyces sp. ISL-90]|nr:DUF3072 domain-containing protein [Streptomyces sp. ISL-90]